MVARAAGKQLLFIMASTPGSSELVRQILPPHLQDAPNYAFESALLAWSLPHLTLHFCCFYVVLVVFII